MANSLWRSEQRTSGRAGSLLSSLSGAEGSVALKLVTLLQGKGEDDLEWTLEPWGLGFCDGTREGQTEGFLEGFGERERVLPRFEDLESARVTLLVC